MLNKPADTPYTGVNKDKISSASPILNEEVKSNLSEFIKDRYEVHINKDVLQTPKPWTNNPVFLDVKFTNVRREHDRNTIWAIETICKSKSLSLIDKIYNIILFRLYNKYQTCDVLLMPFKTSMLSDKSVLEQLRLTLKRKQDLDPEYVFFTSAFNTGGMKAAVGRTTGEEFIPYRPIAFLLQMIDAGLANKIRLAISPKAVCDELMEYSGIGDFLSYQMFVDLTYIPEFPFSENNFTIAGPGCKLGLDLLFESYDGLTHEEAIFWLRDNWSNLYPDMDMSTIFSDLEPHDRCMNVMSLENCFCELGKYIKCIQSIKEGKKPRSRVSYDGNDSQALKSKSKKIPSDDSIRTIPYNGKRITIEENILLISGEQQVSNKVTITPCYTSTLFDPKREFDSSKYDGEFFGGNFFQFLGTNGSGKSTIPKKLVELDTDSYTITKEMAWLSGNMGKGYELEKKKVTFATVCPNLKLILMGDYTPGTNIAGCDVLIRATMELGLDHIMLDEDICNFSVIMEGVVLSSSRWHIDRIKQFGITGISAMRPKMLFMDTPLEVCMERLVKRNAANGKTPNTKNVESKWVETKLKAEKCMNGTHNYDGIDAIWVDHTMEINQSVDWFISEYLQ